MDIISLMEATPRFKIYINENSKHSLLVSAFLIENRNRIDMDNFRFENEDFELSFF